MTIKESSIANALSLRYLRILERLKAHSFGVPMTIQARVAEAFRRRYAQDPPLVVHAPGRVNLIGEHTDYNDGFVLPMAIDRATWIALRPRSDRRVAVYSLDFDQTAEFALDHLGNEKQGWAEYIKGVAWSLQEDGLTLHGWEGVVTGDVPIGAGLSSSAALELATARAFASASGLDWDGAVMAKRSQRAENQWVGVSCGIMDQMISACGRAGHALLIDCRSLAIQPVPLPQDTVVVVLDTATRRGLMDSAYNERRAQCEAAARFFNVPALRDVSVEAFNARASELDGVIRCRARHVITENERTKQAVKAMESNDAKAMGELMVASHNSLRDDFEVSSEALNQIVECALMEASCYGARMTGAGFGGCAVALVRRDYADQFASNVTSSYRRASGLTPNIYVCTPSNGAEVVIGAPSY
jgi:galactokinase